VALSDGNVVSYDKLLLTTGSRIREIKCPGANLPGVHYLRGIADVDGLRAVFHPGRKLVVVGAGYVGLEVAAVAAKHGLDLENPDSFLFFDNGQALEASDAVLALASRLGAPWSWMGVFRIIPKSWRDAAYLLLALTLWRARAVQIPK
jgi:NADH dehydrogenase FAD-containing subunit